MTISVFLVDDHFMVIEGIQSLLSAQPLIRFAGYAISAADCLEKLNHSEPDVILMDINLPDQSGIELCREVKKRYPRIFVLGLSTFNQQSFVRKMMDNGASGYVLKNATGEELTEAIQAVVRGKLYLSDEVAETLRQSNASGELPVVTRREKEVLELIAEGFTNGEIAQKIFVSVTTVDSHRKNLLTKFSVGNTAALVKLAVKNGII